MVQWLAQSDLRLCKHGYSQSDITLLTPLHHIVRNEQLVLECAKLQLYILGDITTVTLRRKSPIWMLMNDDIAPIKDYLPDECPAGHTPLDLGQYWKITHRVNDTLLVGDIIRVDGRTGDYISVTKWTVRNRKYAVQAQGQLLHTHQELFPQPTAIRVTLLKHTTYGYEIRLQREQITLNWTEPPPPTIPSYIQWISQELKGTASFTPRLYTDGSYRSIASIPAVFNPQLATSESSASIVEVDNSHSWKQRPIFIVHITDGHTIQATSAYTMEFLALAAALKLQMQISSGINTDQPIRTAPVKSDAQSIVSMIKGRQKRLRQCTKDHHLLLQCIDNALHRGCPAPVHVRSHA